MNTINRKNLKRLVSPLCVVVVALGMLTLWHNAEANNSKKGKKDKDRDSESNNSKKGRNAGDLVRWDIISIAPLPPADGSVISAGGVAFAFAYHTPTNPSAAWIRFTGGGTFVAPANGGGSSTVNGGGTWQTSGPGLPEASGSYRVTELVNWQFANLASGPPAFNDRIADVNKRANGNAILLIEYDDGTEGILGIGCHGPGAPNGILEGVIASKSHLTYWNGVLPPGPAVDQNRTIFHILRSLDCDDHD